MEGKQNSERRTANQPKEPSTHSELAVDKMVGVVVLGVLGSLLWQMFSNLVVICFTWSLLSNRGLLSTFVLATMDNR